MTSIASSDCGRRQIYGAALLIFATSCADPPGHEPPAAFREIAEQVGLVATHFSGATGKYYMPEIMGSGAALIDYDNDGDLDVFVVQATDLDDPERGSGHQFFRNDIIPSGQLSFKEVTTATGLGKVSYGMGAATGDYDNDGWTDLYVTAFGPNALFRNLGNGSFEEVEPGPQDARFSTGSAFLDYDRDGDLDLFVLNYCDFSIEGKKKCASATGEPDYCTPKAYQPVPDRLFRNDGNGSFNDVTAAAGIDRHFGPGLGIVCQDFNGDGWTDVYVTNDTRRNLLWINRQDGTFVEKGLEAGASYAETGVPRAGMGVGAGDYDNDGDDDLAVFNLTGEGATLFENDGIRDGLPSFHDVTTPRGLRSVTLPYTGFGGGWLDFDNDGWLDVFVANGSAVSQASMAGDSWPFHQPNKLFRNIDGKRFEDAEVGLGHIETSRGAAFGDIDNDGDIDILVTNGNGKLRLLRNTLGGRSLQIELDGPSAGARIGLHLDDGRTLWRRVYVDSSYLSASDPRAHFGLSESAIPVAAEVAWPDGETQRYEKPPTEGTWLISRGAEP